MIHKNTNLPANLEFFNNDNNNNDNNNYNKYSGIVEAYVNWYFRQKKTEKKCICQYVSVKNLI